MISLADYALSPEHHARRKAGLGGSDANAIMSGDPQKVANLWLEKTGQREPDDLSGILAVVMGSHTEPLNALWYARMTGREVYDRNTERTHPTVPWARLSLDGLTSTADGQPAYWEAKHVGGREPIETVLQRYMPQTHHGMWVLGLDYAVISIFSGNGQWECREIEADPLYMGQLIERETAFWRHVETREPPPEWHAVQPPPVPPKGARHRIVDMAQSNSWAEQAGIYVANHDAVAKCEAAAKELKALCPSDAKRAYGHGVVVKVSGKGLTVIKGDDDATE